ncbi:carbohydrate kinase [Exidia glandulosa HHB12029]|uniref:ATP-dependent (S)-NAD(P)H-hydrate dehydratase n=1 Tax=Exidia glandulosa HHB12029 TaxID=1314781 RepID=A0A165JD29_EXIGL|nr:carbohydrate kinase [Exidia glandulosa HHB12029]
MTISKQLLDQVKQLIPPLTGKLHKGQAGRVAVVGGAEEYSGAPFFAAISALRVGVDLSHVLCSPVAAGSIKSYSPDLIVHPIFAPDAPADVVDKELDSLLSRLHVLILGPGLGRSDSMQRYARDALRMARDREMYVVIDADGLYMVQKDPGVIKGYERAVLTPNVVEYGRLCEALKLKKDAKASELSAALDGVTVLQKGSEDVVAYAKEEASVDVAGGLKRCGGQGDILSGAVGAFLAWGKNYETGSFGDKSIPPHRIPFLAALGASTLTRTTSRLAFAERGRSVVTQDMLEYIGQAFDDVFDDRKGYSGKL